MATRDVIPRSDGEGNIGIAARRWASGFFNAQDIDGDLTVTGDVYGNSDNADIDEIINNANATVDIQDYTSLSAAIAAIGTQETTLIISKDTLVNAASITIPSTIEVIVRRDAKFTGANTLLLNCALVAGPWQIFETTVITLASKPLVAQILPQWWGADGVDDNTEDDYDAFYKAIVFAQHSSGKTVYIPAGTYNLGTRIHITTLYDGLNLIGVGSSETILKSITGAGTVTAMIEVQNATDNVTFSGFQIDVANQARKGIELNSISYFHAEDLYIKDSTSYAVTMTSISHSTMQRIRCVNCVGPFLSGTNSTFKEWNLEECNTYDATFTGYFNTFKDFYIVSDHAATICILCSNLDQALIENFYFWVKSNNKTDLIKIDSNSDSVQVLSQACYKDAINITNWINDDVHTTEYAFANAYATGSFSFLPFYNTHVSGQMGLAQFGLGIETVETISGGAINFVSSLIILDTETGATVDDLDTINNGQTGQLLFLRKGTSDNVIVKDGTGNLSLKGDCYLTDVEDYIILRKISYNAITDWIEVSRSLHNDRPQRINLGGWFLDAAGAREYNDTTIATDAIDITAIEGSSVSLRGEGAAADDLETISNGKLDDVLLIRTEGTETITVKETGNLVLGAATRVLDNVADVLILACHGASWSEVSYSDNA